MNQSVEQLLNDLYPQSPVWEEQTEFDAVSQYLYDLKKQIKKLSEEEKSLEQRLRSIADNKSHTSLNFVYSCEYRKGNIDYSVIPALKGLDLERYRKADTPVWKLIKL